MHSNLHRSHSNPGPGILGDAPPGFHRINNVMMGNQGRGSSNDGSPIGLIGQEGNYGNQDMEMENRKLSVRNHGNHLQKGPSPPMVGGMNTDPMNSGAMNSGAMNSGVMNSGLNPMNSAESQLDMVSNLLKMGSLQPNQQQGLLNNTQLNPQTQNNPCHPNNSGSTGNIGNPGNAGNPGHSPGLHGNNSGLLSNNSSSGFLGNQNPCGYFGNHTSTGFIGNTRNVYLSNNSSYRGNAPTAILGNVSSTALLDNNPHSLLGLSGSVNPGLLGNSPTGLLRRTTGHSPDTMGGAAFELFSNHGDQRQGSSSGFHGNQNNIGLRLMASIGPRSGNGMCSNRFTSSSGSSSGTVSTLFDCYHGNSHINSLLFLPLTVHVECVLNGMCA